MKIVTIAPLKSGTRVAVNNCCNYGVVAKRAGKNRYWVTISTNGITATTLLNRNTFKAA